MKELSTFKIFSVTVASAKKIMNLSGSMWARFKLLRPYRPKRSGRVVEDMMDKEVGAVEVEAVARKGAEYV